MYINHFDRVLEKSTQFYYFSQKILDGLDSNTEMKNFFSDWVYSDGPGSDERYQPNFTSKDYIEMLTPEEMKYLEKEFKIRFGVYEAEEKGDSEDTDVPDKKVELKPVALVPGTLVLITNFGSDKEPKKYAWNKSKGEILKKNPNGTYKIRITDIKDSNILFTKKWYNQEKRALTQKLNLKKDEFQTLKEIDDIELAAKAEKDKPKPDKPEEK